MDTVMAWSLLESSKDCRQRVEKERMKTMRSGCCGCCCCYYYCNLEEFGNAASRSEMSARDERDTVDEEVALAGRQDG